MILPSKSKAKEDKVDVSSFLHPSSFSCVYMKYGKSQLSWFSPNLFVNLYYKYIKTMQRTHLTAV